jgi:methionyl-tRNA formyltransferase
MPPSIERVILLASQTGGSELTKFLKLQNPGLDVIHVPKAEDLHALPLDCLRTARLIGFGTDIIVPAMILNRLGFDAYNFHPGPPSHPGWAPACFAIYDGAQVFGATAHRMVAKVDAGPIVGTEFFPLRPEATPEQLARESIVAMLHLFRRLGPLLATRTEPLPSLPVEWGAPKRRRSDLVELCAMPGNLDEEEIARRFRAFTVDDPAYPRPRLVDTVRNPG